MQVSVISLNGLQELSGGGLYLRSLVQGMIDTGAVEAMTVVSKKMGAVEPSFRHPIVREVELEKSVCLDVQARLRLQPTFLGAYRRRIVAACEGADLIVLHNSRAGLILRALKQRFPKAKIVMACDNVEVDLQRQQREEKKGLAKLLARLEEYEIRRAEACCLAADAMTFITRVDSAQYEAIYGRPKLTGILPITVKDAEVIDVPVAADGVDSGHVLFTGHFGFKPNVDSLDVVLQVAQAVNQERSPAGAVKFVVAGAGLDRLPPPRVVGVSYRSSPSARQMDTLFRQASCYLAPVLWGSGMKTKVAEALSYGLPVVALPHAAVGYEDMLGDPECARVLDVAQDVSGLAGKLLARIDGGHASDDRDVALLAYRKWYSSAAQASRFARCFTQLGLV